MPSNYSNGAPGGAVAVMDTATVEVSSSALTMSLSQLSVSAADEELVIAPQTAKLQKLPLDSLQQLCAKYSASLDRLSRDLMDELQRKEALDRRHRALAYMRQVLAAARGEAVRGEDEWGTNGHARAELDLCLVADMMTQYGFMNAPAVGRTNEVLSFTGHSAVTWMLSSLPGLVDTRKRGEQLGQQMMSSGIIQRAAQETGYFVDSTDVYYTFSEHEPRVPLNLSRRWPADLLARRPLRVVTDLLLTLTELLNATVGDGEKPTPRLLADVRKTRVWREYKSDACELEAVDLGNLTTEIEKLAFFLNLYNVMVLHGLICMGPPLDAVSRIGFYKRTTFRVGGLTFSAMEVEHAILRASSSSPQMGFAGKFLLTIPRFYKGDPRAVFALKKAVPQISFALFYGCRMGPQLPPPFTPEAVERQLLQCTQQYLAAQVDFRITRDPERQSKILRVCVPELLEWYARDFGNSETARAKWIVDRLPPDYAERAEYASYASVGRARVYEKEFNWAPLYSVLPVERRFAPTEH